MPASAGELRETPPLVHRWAMDAIAPLAAGQLHIWSVDLDDASSDLEELERLLSPDERTRANRFRFDRDRARYTVGRGTLREILGAYLGVHPAEVKIGKDGHGKPFVVQATRASPALQFNVAHADRLALLAFAFGHDVGVDVERLEPLPDADVIAEGYFARAERDVLAGLPPGEKAEAFYSCWTRKEAYLKAIGLGLAAPLDRFEVTLSAEEPARLVRIDGDPVEAERWAVHSLEPAADYRGAVAIRTTALTPRCARWPGAERHGR